MNLLTMVHGMNQTASKLFAEQMNGSDVTPTQAMILIAINDNPGCSQAKLVNATGVDRSTLADVIRRLTKRGITERKRTKEDARAYAVRVTAEGKRLLTEARAAATKAERALRAQYPGLDKVSAQTLQAAE